MPYKKLKPVILDKRKRREHEEVDLIWSWDSG